ncbi:hypothetical protein H5W18_09195 [Lactobacillus sp. Marseille-P7033]|nr:hypothetical protein [Lactobacillus sp. Marseille-P7033]NGC77157.1 hypothetical protein [Limosilactobacillus reuteri]
MLCESARHCRAFVSRVEEQLTKELISMAKIEYIHTSNYEAIYIEVNDLVDAIGSEADDLNDVDEASDLLSLTTTITDAMSTDSHCIILNSNSLNYIVPTAEMPYLATLDEIKTDSDLMAWLSNKIDLVDDDCSTNSSVNVRS